MKEILCNFFGFRSSRQSAFSKFFTDFSSREKKNVVKKAIRGANEEQKALMEKYRQKFAR